MKLCRLGTLWVTQALCPQGKVHTSFSRPLTNAHHNLLQSQTAQCLGAFISIASAHNTFLHRSATNSK